MRIQNFHQDKSEINFLLIIGLCEGGRYTEYEPIRIYKENDYVTTTNVNGVQFRNSMDRDRYCAFEKICTKALWHGTEVDPSSF